jgi:hypothetical protein
MTTETMTIHEALSELKMLNSRINKEINSMKFVTVNKHSNNKIDGKSLEEYKNNVSAQYQKITDMIKRRTAIKKAVVKSNAVTEVNINGEVMTVAEAIEYKNTGIDFIVTLTDRLITDYNFAKSEIALHNGDALEDKANDHIYRLFGSKDNNTDKDVIESTKKSFIENNSLDLVDSIKIEKEIKELTNKIDSFTSKVDSVLSTSNATTTITVSY